MSGQRKEDRSVTDDDGIVSDGVQEVHGFTGSQVHRFTGSRVHGFEFEFGSGSRFGVGTEMMEPVKPVNL
jgi:hypothetical protein